MVPLLLPVFVVCDLIQLFGQCSCLRTVFLFFLPAVYSWPSLEVDPPPDRSTLASIVPAVNDSAPPFLFFSVSQFRRLLYGVRKWPPPNGRSFQVSALGVRGHVWVEEAVNWADCAGVRGQTGECRRSTCTGSWCSSEEVSEQEQMRT